MPRGRHQDVVLGDHRLGLEALEVAAAAAAGCAGSAGRGCAAADRGGRRRRRPSPGSGPGCCWFCWLSRFCWSWFAVLAARGSAGLLAARSGSGRGCRLGAPGGRCCRPSRLRSLVCPRFAALAVVRRPSGVALGRRRRSRRTGSGRWARSPARRVARSAGRRRSAPSPSRGGARCRSSRRGRVIVAAGRRSRPPLPGARTATAALGGPDGVDQLALAHRAGALETECAGQLLELGQDHAVQPGALALAAGAGLIRRRRSSLRRYLSTCVPSYVGHSQSCPR